MQECIASVASVARARGAFAIGGVNGYSNENFDATVHLLEPSEHLHSNMSNLIAHVWIIMKDDMATMPEEVIAPDPDLRSLAVHRNSCSCVLPNP